MGNLRKTLALMLVFIFLSSLVFLPSSVKAQTPSVLNNYNGTVDSYFLHGGIYAYTINVSMSVETESNGEWVVGNSYQITWQISIVNFNPNAIKQPNNLSLTLHDPLVRISGNLKTVISQTFVTIGQDGLLKVEFTPNKPSNQANIQTLLVEDENYSSQEQFKNGHWDQNFDIGINIVDSLSTLPPVTSSSTPSPSAPELSWLMIILALLGTSTFTVVFQYWRKRANTYSKIE
jgi:hypothetical protein